MLFIFRGECSGGDTLQNCGISEGSTVAFSLCTFSDETPYKETFFINDVVSSVQQTQKGISVFLSSLYALVSSVLSCIVPIILLPYDPLHLIFCITLSIVSRYYNFFPIDVV